MIDIDALEALAKAADQSGIDFEFAASIRPSEILALIAEVRALRERLEVDPSHPYDGIACRDETIRQQDRELANLRAKLETPIAMEIKWSPLETTMIDGWSPEVAGDALARGKKVTIYYGRTQEHSARGAK